MRLDDSKKLQILAVAMAAATRWTLRKGLGDGHRGRSPGQHDPLARDLPQHA